MKNVKETQLVRSFVLSYDEFCDALKSVADEGLFFEVSLDGISYSTKTMDENEFNEKLTEYFDVDEITSVHADDCETVGIWVTYKDKSKPKKAVSERNGTAEIEDGTSYLLRRIFDKAFEINMREETPQDSLSRMCTTYLPGCIQNLSYYEQNYDS